MAKFVFKARNAQKELVEGTRAAESEKELLAALRNEGLVVFAVSEEGVAAKAKKEKQKTFVKKGGSIKSQDIAVFCRQLATLINAGVNILDALEDISGMVTNRNFQKILTGIAGDIRGGSTLSDAMQKHHKVFGKVFISLIAAGERSGKLGKVLKDLALYLENAVKLKRKVQSASAYPAFIAVFFIAIMLVMVLLIIPKFQTMFASFGADLPAPTKIVMGISNGIIDNFLWINMFVLGLAVGGVMTYKNPGGRLMIDSAKLTVPVFGPMMQKILLARFFQTLATLLKSGVDIVISIEIASKVTNNYYVEQVLDKVKNRIVEGSTFSDELARFKVFPYMVVRMIGVGEKSGQLDEMCSKLSDYYNDEVEAIVATMSSIIEPVFIVLLGVVVGIAVIAMYLPIFKMALAMTGGQ